MTSALRERTLLPPEDPSDLARFARGLAEVQAPTRARLVGPDGSEIEIPEDLYGVLRDVVEALSQGMAISIAPHNTMLTTQEVSGVPPRSVGAPRILFVLATSLALPTTLRFSSVVGFLTTSWLPRIV